MKHIKGANTMKKDKVNKSAVCAIAIMLLLFILNSCVKGFNNNSVKAKGIGINDYTYSADFTAFLDESYKKILLRSPELVTQSGLNDWTNLDNSTLDGMSLEFIKENEKIETATLKALNEYKSDTLSKGDLLSRDAYKQALSDSLAMYKFQDMDYVVNPTVFGIAYAIDSLFAETHPLVTKKDALDYVSRLELVDKKVAEVVEGLQRRYDKNFIAPNIILNASLGDIEAVKNASALETTFYTSIQNKIQNINDLSKNEKEALLKKTETICTNKIIPAYSKLYDEVIRNLQKAPSEIGVWTMPNGKEYYETLIKIKTGSSMSADEIHSLGLKELDRIHAEILETAKKSKALASGTAMEVMGKAYSQQNTIGPKEVLSAYTKRLRDTEKLLEAYFPFYNKTPVEVKTAPFGGYYSPGPIDGSRPGVFFVASGTGANKAGMPTLLYHETVPGHHLQISMAQSVKGPVLRKLLFFGSYTEGWALYAERFMSEIGIYNDNPEGNIGRLQAEAFRAARLVVDTGIHSKKWDFEKSVNFMIEKAFMPRRAAEGEVMRYASIPAQALTYYIGYMKILDLREKARKELGSQFDLAAYHETILSCRALPLNLLEKVVATYIEEGKK